MMNEAKQVFLGDLMHRLSLDLLDKAYSELNDEENETIELIIGSVNKELTDDMFEYNVENEYQDDDYQEGNSPFYNGNDDTGNQDYRRQQMDEENATDLRNTSRDIDDNIRDFERENQDLRKLLKDYSEQNVSLDVMKRDLNDAIREMEIIKNDISRDVEQMRDLKYY